MCGICGIVDQSNNSINPSDIEIINNLAKHRGPDDEGYYFGSNFAFGHRRLSIIDLSKNGHQPMSYNDQYTIVFNGDEPLEVRIPAHMNLRVIKTDPGERGNTAQGGTKPAKLESGITINVPLFIQENEIVRVDTRDKRYIERIK